MEIDTLQGSLAMAIDMTELEAEDKDLTNNYPPGEHPREIFNKKMEGYIDHLIKAKDDKDEVAQGVPLELGITDLDEREQRENEHARIKLNKYVKVKKGGGSSKKGGKGLAGLVKRTGGAPLPPAAIPTTQSHEDAFGDAFGEMQALVQLQAPGGAGPKPSHEPSRAGNGSQPPRRQMRRLGGSRVSDNL